MANQVENISQYLKSLGLNSLLEDVPGVNDFKRVVINYVGVNMTVDLHLAGIPSLNMYLFFAYIPKINIAPVFRKLLNLNNLLFAKLFIDENINAIGMKFQRPLEGLDFVEFKWMLDSLGAAFHQHAIPLVNEFQLPQQPV